MLIIRQITGLDSMTEMTKGDIVALDGKRLRGSYDKASCKSAIHMVSAFAATNGLCLGQVVTDQKSNEITAIPKLLDMLALKGCLVTIDAMGCQKKIAKKIISRKADYILAVKENQEELLEEVKKVFDITALSSTDKSHDVGHGRAEIRTCSIINDLRFLDIDKANWKGLKSIVKIESERYIKISGKTQREIRYYISSSEKEAGEINHSVRNHWAIENNLHWMLDVEFKEDGSRRRMGNSAANFNIINKMALSMLKKHKGKNSVRQTRYRATLSPNFREKLFGF